MEHSVLLQGPIKALTQTSTDISKSGGCVIARYVGADVIPRFEGRYFRSHCLNNTSAVRSRNDIRPDR